MPTYPLIDVPWADERADALERAFGPPATVQHLPFPTAHGLNIPQVHVWEWPGRFGDATLLLTEGLSDVSLVDGDGEPAGCRVELLTISSSPTWAGNLLRAASQAILQLYGSLFIGPGETLALANPPAPLAEGSSLTRLAFLPPPLDLFDAGEALMETRVGGDKLVVLWCLGVTEAELALLHSGDLMAVTSAFASKALVTAPDRPSLA